MFEVNPSVLVLTAPRHGCKTLDEVEDACRRVPLFPQDRLNDLGAVAFAEALIFKERLSIIIIAGDDGFSRHLHASNEALGARVREVLQGRRHFISEAVAGVFAVPDDDLFEALNAPEVPVLADATKVETGNAERLGANLRVPAIETSEIKIGLAAWQPPCLNRVRVVDQEEEDVTVTGVQWTCFGKVESSLL